MNEVGQECDWPAPHRSGVVAVDVIPFGVLAGHHRLAHTRRSVEEFVGRSRGTAGGRNSGHFGDLPVDRPADWVESTEQLVDLEKQGRTSSGLPHTLI
jgi:hypothetical protein